MCRLLVLNLLLPFYICRMYSKQEAAQLKQEFWTTFGQYMSPVFSAEGEKINWINYKTGEKDIYFRMYADGKSAKIGIELTHKDPGIRHLYFEQCCQYQTILEKVLRERWEWRKDDWESGKL